MSSVAHGCLELWPCFASLNTLVPRVMKLDVTSTSAVSEPRTAATATTVFPGFPNGAAFAAYGTDYLRRGCWCSYEESIDQRNKNRIVN